MNGAAAASLNSIFSNNISNRNVQILQSHFLKNHHQITSFLNVNNKIKMEQKSTVIITHAYTGILKSLKASSYEWWWERGARESLESHTQYKDFF